MSVDEALQYVKEKRNCIMIATDNGPHPKSDGELVPWQGLDEQESDADRGAHVSEPTTSGQSDSVAHDSGQWRLFSSPLAFAGCVVKSAKL